MMTSQNEKDFQDFVASSGNTPVKSLDDQVLSYVATDMESSHFKVFLKLLGIQSLIGILTLTFCPQFDLSLTNQTELFHYFHRQYGSQICFALCGAIFIGSGTIFASYILTAIEINKIKESEFLYYLTLTGVMIIALSLLGANVYLEAAAFWFVGAWTAGLIMFETNRMIRLKISALSTDH